MFELFCGKEVLMRSRTIYSTKRKGTTLAEIAIVLAVLSVISTVVLSFVLMVSRRARASSARLEAMQDIEFVETLTESWINVMRENGATFVTDADRPNVLKAVIPDNSLISSSRSEAVSFTLSYDSASGTLIGTLPNDRMSLTFTSQRVSSMKFDATSEIVLIDDPCVFFCSLEYSIPLVGYDTGKTFNYNFCVNSRIGYELGGIEGGR